MKKIIIAALAASLCMLTATAYAAETDVLAGAVQQDEVAANYPAVTGFENTATGVRVSWSAYPNAARYGLFYLDESGWHGIRSTTSLSMEVEDLANEQVYTFTVRAMDKDYNYISDFNRGGWRWQYIAPPVISSLKNTEQGVQITWNKSNAAALYRVYRRDASHGWARIGNVADTTFTDATAQSGVNYSYTVRTLSDDGSDTTSYYNDGKSITFVATPQVTEIWNRDNGARLYWNAVRGAAQYRVFYRDNTGWHGIGNTADTAFTHEGLRNNTAYTYTVRCLDKNGDFISGFNGDGWTNTFLAPPTVTSLRNTETGVAVSWNKTAGAVRYRVYRKDASHGWARIGETTDNAYMDKTAQSGTAYSYTVRSITADGSKETSYFTDGKSISFVAAPQVTEILNRGNGARIYWNAVKGAAKYRVFYRDNTGWHGIGNTADTAFTHEGLRNNTTYTYTVRCLDKNGDFISDFNGDGWTNTFLAPPQVNSLDNAADGVAVSWNKTAGAVRYRVYRKDSSHGWARIGETTGNTYMDTTAQSGTSYSYTVRSITADGSKETSYFTDGKSITYVAMPKITSAENNDASVTLYWKAVKGAAKYRVFYLDPKDGWKGLGNTADTSYTHANLKNYDTFTYTVRCLDKNGDFISAYDRNGFTHRFLAPPAIADVSRRLDSNVITWNPVDGISAYRLYRKTVSTGWARVSDSVADTKYTDTDAQNNVLYTYTLRCLGDDGEPITGYIGDTQYYLNGKLANGTVRQGNNTYYFDNGYFRSGYQKINGKTYYYKDNGKIAKNEIVGTASAGYTYADADGVCVESEEIRLAAKFMMEKCKGNTPKERAKDAFRYMSRNFPYHRTYDHPKTASDIPRLAIDMFTNERGNCYRYAACYTCIAKLAGYRARMVFGTTAGLPHGWTEVLVDGQWLICDVDANIPGYGKPDYTAYMMKYHYWDLLPESKHELTFKDGKAIWN